MERPDWNKGDTLASVKEILIIGALSVRQCCIDALDWADTKLADRINTKDDE